METVDFSKFKIRSFLTINFFILQVFSYWPPKTKSKTISYLYLAYSSAMIIATMILYGLMEYTNVVMVAGDLQAMIQSSLILLTNTAQLVKLYYLIRRNDEIKKLVDDMDLEIFKPKNMKHYKIIITVMTGCRRLTIIFLSQAFSTVVLIGVYPLTDAVEDRRLPLPGWFPYDTTKTPAYQITYLYQWLGVGIHALTNICKDTIATAIMAHMCGQIDILNDILSNLDAYARDEFESQVSISNELLSKEMNKVLIECVHRHRKILSMADELNSVYTIPALAQFAAAVIIICITMYQLTVLPVLSAEFASTVGYLAGMFVQLLLYCWYGNEIILKSGELFKSAYASNWTECSTSFQRNLLIFMMRVQKPIKLYAGNFFALSLESYSAILRSSWSYFAVLQKVQNKP